MLKGFLQLVAFAVAGAAVFGLFFACAALADNPIIWVSVVGKIGLTGFVLVGISVIALIVWDIVDNKRIV